ncbi:unnamed protein product [Trifolium pratense]|uniref:Uncharacterized protein n=1 Tax=Trifolium pratense TaxID=57577 RepID=A0ACB0M3S4_TRIPR|nr:unnamed protein product [Trifolium pratense]
MTTYIKILIFTIAIICVASITFADKIGLNCFQTNYCPKDSFHCANDCKAKGYHSGGDCFMDMPYCCCNSNV